MKNDEQNINKNPGQGMQAKSTKMQAIHKQRPRIIYEKMQDLIVYS